MTITEMQSKIRELKEKTDTVVLAHSYQAREIIEAADIKGDSFQLSVNARDLKHRNLVLCGVKFMAETAKILSRDKRVFLANPQTGCPMAELLSPEALIELKNAEPDRAVVAYINTTAELKKLCDVCVTSSAAVQIVRNMKEEKILFIPDCNLGDYIKKQVPEKDIKLIEGGCPVHDAVTADDVKTAQAKYPGAPVLVHPECKPEVLELADYVGSTTGIMEYAKNSDKHEFIIGTEISIAEHLQYDCPGKNFYPLSGKILCPDMKLTTLPDLLKTLESIEKDDGGACEIIMSDEEMEQAGRCIENMIELSARQGNFGEREILQSS
ncbi:MAG: quinolinate synthase NadA [Oscillospiraceae bacterium]|jgi:quinolinate synthase|nr:quinolinate synthase NadA [Oscillospiraceae bacterium]